jgi:hypothetical protein
MFHDSKDQREERDMLSGRRERKEQREGKVRLCHRTVRCVTDTKDDIRMVTVASADDDWETEVGFNRRGTSSAIFFAVNSPKGR